MSLYLFGWTRWGGCDRSRGDPWCVVATRTARHVSSLAVAMAKCDLVAGYLEVAVGASEDHHVLAIDCWVEIQDPQIVSHGLDYIFRSLCHVHVFVELVDVNCHTVNELRGFFVRRLDLVGKAAEVVGAIELALREDLECLSDRYILGAVEDPHWLSLVADLAP